MKWVASWGIAPCDIRFASPKYSNSTMRLSIVNALPGDAIRLRFSNRDGLKPTMIARVSVSIGDGPHPITFSGQPSAALQPGANLYSDAVRTDVQPGVTTISVAFTGDVQCGNGVPAVVQCSPKGDYVDAPQFQSVHRSKTACYYDMIQPVAGLCDVEVHTSDDAGALVCFGDSITQQGRWTGPLAGRLAADGSRLTVINRSIGGNRLMHGPMPLIGAGYGQAGKLRFQRDVLETPGARAVLIAIGANDIGLVRNPKSSAWVDAETLIREMEATTHRARESRLLVIGSTLLPRVGIRGYGDLQEAQRKRYNEWVMASDVFDAKLDFDRLTRDPGHPEIMRFAYDSGDHLHPGVLGGKRMAEEVYEVIQELGL